MTWSEFKEKSAKYEGDQFMDKLMKRIIEYYRIDRLMNDLRARWNTFKTTRTYDTFHEFLRHFAQSIILVFSACYGVLNAFNIFVLPLITLYLTYDGMSMHQIWFNIIYFGLLIVICYRLWALIKYEMIMWYIIPDLGSLRCTRKDIDDFYGYYKYINKDITLIQIAVSEFVGKDVANIIMLYTPDYISNYKENQTTVCANAYSKRSVLR